jgi:protein disulfide-isomerase A1
MVQRLLAALLLAGATAQSTEGGVFVLTDGTAKSFIDSKPITLVHYYAQWCAKCKTLAPKLEKVAEKAKAKGWPIAIAKVDAKEQEEAAKDVYGYPTLKIFHGKDSSEYEGPREVDDIMKYLERLVTSQTLPTMKAPADLTKLAKAGKEPVVLGLFREPVKASAAYKTFKEAAFEFHGQGVKFAYSAGATNPPVAPLNAVGQQEA